MNAYQRRKAKRVIKKNQNEYIKNWCIENNTDYNGWIKEENRRFKRITNDFYKSLNAASRYRQFCK